MRGTTTIKSCTCSSLRNLSYPEHIISKNAKSPKIQPQVFDDISSTGTRVALKPCGDQRLLSFLTLRAK